jgi:thymidylate kinase
MNTDQAKKPFFIFIEGADGVGKSTTSALLKEVLTDAWKKEVEQTFIMQFTEVGALCRTIAIKDDTVSDELKFLSYCFSTFYGLDKLIGSFEKQDFVIVDRSQGSTFAQSICASNVTESMKTYMINIFSVLNEKFKNDYKDRHLFVNLTATAKGALDRLHKERGELDVLEKRGPVYQDKIKVGYDLFYKYYIEKENVITLNTEEKLPMTVITDILTHLKVKGKL